LTHQECLEQEDKLKISAKNKFIPERMDQESASRFYTVQRIVEDSKGVSLQRLAVAPQPPAKTGETITMKPRIVKTGARTAKSVSVFKTEPQLRIKAANGGRRYVTAPPKQKETQPDFMKIAFEELDDGSVADQDTKNMEALFL
jgi:hypothetical protein